MTKYGELICLESGADHLDEAQQVRRDSYAALFVKSVDDYFINRTNTGRINCMTKMLQDRASSKGIKGVTYDVARPFVLGLKKGNVATAFNPAFPVCHVIVCRVILVHTELETKLHRESKAKKAEERAKKAKERREEKRRARVDAVSSDDSSSEDASDEADSSDEEGEISSKEKVAEGRSMCANSLTVEKYVHRYRYHSDLTSSFIRWGNECWHS